jgi:SAM-dependent methyltransferase
VLLPNKYIQLIKTFKNIDNTYLEFPSSISLLSNQALIAREELIVRNLKNLDLNRFISATGSPSIEVIYNLIHQLRILKMVPYMEGVGVELGSGLGILSSVFVKNFENIDLIFAVEACKSYAEVGISLTANSVLGHNAKKIIPCFGSFESIPLKDGSIDFVIQIESLHHADTLISPIAESFRLLKKGGIFISIDRSWIDSVSDTTLENLLSHRYDDKWLENKGFDKLKVNTRKDNGEHEYRDREWIEVFKEAGYTNLLYIPIHPKITWKFAIKRLLTLLHLTRVLKIEVQSRPGLFRGIICKFLKINPKKLSAQLISDHPRPLVVSVWQK